MRIRRLFLLINSQDEKLKFIVKDVQVTERNMDQLRKTIEVYVKNQHRLREKSLKLSVDLKNFGDSEATKLGDFLRNFGEAVYAREMFREEKTSRISLYSIEPLKLYHILCNKLKNEVKSRETALDKEQKKLSSLDRVMIREGNNRSKVTQNQLELVAASSEVQHATSSLLQSVERFETQKRADLKAALGEFLQSEIEFHARTLELLSEVHKELQDMDFEEDIAEICEKVEQATSRPSSPLSFREKSIKSPIRSPIQQAAKDPYLTKGYATGMVNSPINSGYHYLPLTTNRSPKKQTFENVPELQKLAINTQRRPKSAFRA